MATTLRHPIAPMEADSVDAIPTGPGWLYEPKWDGFRCLAFRNGREVYLQSKAQKPLARYFPEIVAALEEIKAKHFVLDGELVVPVHGDLNFDQLLQRIHPAESRIRKLAELHPALFIVFDLLVDTNGRSLLSLPMRERQKLLEDFSRRYLSATDRVRLSPATTDLRKAKQWFQKSGGDLDGVIAKLADSPYRAGERDAMVKIKNQRTADCVVGGFRYASNKRVVGSLLLGLYDEQGLLHHVGFTANMKSAERPALTRKLEKLIQPPGFTGQAPGGPSRWSTERSTEWQPLAPKLVVEVIFDHVTGNRFRHGTSFHRWRTDKSPAQCTLRQLKQSRGKKLKLIK